MKKNFKSNFGYNVVIFILVVILLIFAFTIRNQRRIISEDANKNVIPTIELRDNRVFILGEEMIFEKGKMDLVEYYIERRDEEYYLMAKYKEDLVEVTMLNKNQVNEIAKKVSVGYVLDFNLLQ